MSFLLSLLLLFQLPMGGVTGSSAWPANPKSIFFRDSGGFGTGGGACNTGTTTCIVNVSSIAANDSLVCFVFMGNNTTISSCSGETWSACPVSCNVNNTNGGTVDALYVARAAGGETTVTCTIAANASVYYGCGVIDVGKWSGTTVVADTSGALANGGCTSCLAPSLTLTGVNDACVETAVSVIGGNATDITAPYHANVQTYDGTGETAANRIVTTPQQPTWSWSSNSQVVMNAICFKGS